MRPSVRHALTWLLATLVLASVAAVVCGRIAASRARDRLAGDVRTEARLRASLIDSEIARFRLVPLALGDDRDVVATLAGEAAAAARLNRKLEGLARTTGAPVLYLLAPSGRAIAASNWRTPTSFVGTDYSFRRYTRDALRDGSAEQFAMGSVSRHPGQLRYLRPSVCAGRQRRQLVGLHQLGHAGRHAVRGLYPDGREC